MRAPAWGQRQEPLSLLPGTALGLDRMSLGWSLFRQHRPSHLSSAIPAVGTSLLVWALCRTPGLGRGPSAWSQESCSLEISTAT